MTRTTQSIAREGGHLMDQLPAVRETVRETLGTLQTHLRDADARTRALIQERPLTALAAAIAVGFLLRRLLPFGR
jgi:ElaB/YqjD/DUF883 family membrane-anchored ribosome-binding protein